MTRTANICKLGENAHIGELTQNISKGLRGKWLKKPTLLKFSIRNATLE